MKKTVMPAKTPANDSAATAAAGRTGATTTGHSAASIAATALRAPPRRVAGLIIKDNESFSIPPDVQEAMLWRAMDICATAEQRAHVRGIPAALGIIRVDFPFGGHTYNMPILGPLASKYTALARSLQVLDIDLAANDYDESTDLSAFAALATRLQELTLSCLGLVSVRGLEGRCENLRKVAFRHCQHLSSLDGLAHHVFLEEVTVSSAPIASVEPLSLCPALTRVGLIGCYQLSSLHGLEGHQWLKEVDVSGSAITDLEPLHTCPALSKVTLDDCEELSSLRGLEDHQWLQEVVASRSSITSIEPLGTCPALTKVDLYYCRQLTSLKGLEGHQWLKEIVVSRTPITSIEPLRTCPGLKKVVLSGCPLTIRVQFPADTIVIW